nr:RluA family pseudouridine synthase [Maliibacterium massiliense]
MCDAGAPRQGETRALCVAQEEAGTRLDVFLAAHGVATRSMAQHLIRQGCVQVAGKACAQVSCKLKAGAQVTAIIPPPAPMALVGEDIPLQILYEDSDLIVINKPRGLVVHPAAGNETGTLVQALLYHCGDLSGIGGALRPGIVHRLDKDTTGSLVVAKSDMAHQSLSAQIKQRSVLRRYWAIVDGNIKQDEGLIEAPIGRHPVHRKRMAVVPNGREAATEYRVLARFGGQYTFVELHLRTGRTHQIRVHMASIGHPVTGDPLYGAKKCKLGMLEAQALHARLLGFAHPRTGVQMTFEAPLFPDFAKALETLRKMYP